MKNKLKSSAFWLSATAGVIVLLNSLGSVFNFSVNDIAITSVAASVIGLLVVIGVLNKAEKNSCKTNQEENNQNKTENGLNEKQKDVATNTKEDFEKVSEMLNKEFEEKFAEIKQEEEKLTKK